MPNGTMSPQKRELCSLSLKCLCVRKTAQYMNFVVHRAVYRNIISIVKPTRCTNVSNLFYFGMTLYMFRTVFPSIIRNSRLYIQQQAYVKQTDTADCLLANRQQYLYIQQMPLAVCTVLNFWWWKERPSETCTASFQNKINLIHWCILLVLL